MSATVETMIATLRREPYQIRDERVLAAMANVPRTEFLSAAWKHAAYEDRALPLGHGQTISQPYIVAAMLEMLDPQPDHRVLEIGAGTGYQAAVLAELAGAVYSAEIVGELAGLARDNLTRLKIGNVSVNHGDGCDAWVEKAPFDRIILACAPRSIPDVLRHQLADGGSIVYPEGDDRRQHLYLQTRAGDSWTKERSFAVKFVPMTGDLR